MSSLSVALKYVYAGPLIQVAPAPCCRTDKNAYMSLYVET